MRKWKMEELLGHLPDGWTVQKLLGAHSSQPFNPAIAGAFFRASEIEAWGRGIQRIFGACRDADTPEPRIEYVPAYSMRTCLGTVRLWHFSPKIMENINKPCLTPYPGCSWALSRR